MNLNPTFAAAVAAHAPAAFAREFADFDSPRNDRQWHEYYGIPTGPEPEQVRCQDCWTWKPKGQKCGHCAEMAEREKHAAVIRELGMTPEEFLKEPASLFHGELSGNGGLPPSDAVISIPERGAEVSSCAGGHIEGHRSDRNGRDSLERQAKIPEIRTMCATCQWPNCGCWDAYPVDAEGRAA